MRTKLWAKQEHVFTISQHSLSAQHDLDLLASNKTARNTSSCHDNILVTHKQTSTHCTHELGKHFMPSAIQSWRGNKKLFSWQINLDKI